MGSFSSGGVLGATETVEFHVLPAVGELTTPKSCSTSSCFLRGLDNLYTERGSKGPSRLELKVKPAGTERRSKRGQPKASRGVSIRVV